MDMSKQFNSNNFLKFLTKIYDETNFLEPSKLHLKDIKRLV